MRGAAGAIVRARARPASAQLIAAAAGAVRPIATEPDHALQCSATLETGILQGSAQVIRQQARAAAVHRWCWQHRRLPPSPLPECQRVAGLGGGNPRSLESANEASRGGRRPGTRPAVGTPIAVSGTLDLCGARRGTRRGICTRNPAPADQARPCSPQRGGSCACSSTRPSGARGPVRADVDAAPR